MRNYLEKSVLACLLAALPLAGCGSDPVEAGYARSTPLPAWDDEAAIERIAVRLSDEGAYSDRDMFRGFMLGRKLTRSGALQTSDRERYNAPSVELAIATERAHRRTQEANVVSFAKRREQGDLAIAQEDCAELQRGFAGAGIYADGYEFKGITYGDPCAALKAHRG